MDYRKEFLVKPGERVKLRKIDADYRGKHISKKEALPAIQKYCEKLSKLQLILYAERKHSIRYSSCCRLWTRRAKMERSLTFWGR